MSWKISFFLSHFERNCFSIFSGSWLRLRENSVNPHWQPRTNPVNPVLLQNMAQSIRLMAACCVLYSESRADTCCIVRTNTAKIVDTNASKRILFDNLQTLACILESVLLSSFNKRKLKKKRKNLFKIKTDLK